MITLVVKSRLIKLEDLLGTRIDTKTAAFAQVVIKCDFCHCLILPLINS